jgi:hypothetical protein
LGAITFFFPQQAVLQNVKQLLSHGRNIRVRFEKENFFVMSVAEMKLEAINKITKLENEAVLQDVLSMLEAATAKEAADGDLAKNYDAIKAQYSDVLQKLAQ